jgi:uncharacterized protein (TIGR00299 family) protein
MRFDAERPRRPEGGQSLIASSPMEILYIDPFAGASGDMFLGALVDLGVDFEALRESLRALDVKGFDLRRTEVLRHQIAATKVDVVVEDVPHPHRHLRHLLEIIERAPLAARVQEQSAAALTALAEAEARVHRLPVEKVHLHEVGGLDCLVDVVGTVLAVEALGVERVLSAPVTVGSGLVRCAHGVMPVPAPGTLAILEGFPIRRTQLPFEMTTPTGAALLVTLAEPMTQPVSMIPRAIGHGAGTRDTPEIANFLRMVRADLLGVGAMAHAHEHHHHHHDHGHSHEHDDDLHPPGHTHVHP